MATRNPHPGIQPAEDMHGHPTTVRGEPLDGLPLRGPNDDEGMSRPPPTPEAKGPPHLEAVPQP